MYAKERRGKCVLYVSTLFEIIMSLGYYARRDWPVKWAIFCSRPAENVFFDLSPRFIKCFITCTTCYELNVLAKI